MKFVKEFGNNRTTGAIIMNSVISAIALFINGFGVYLTIQANIGAGPWDVLNLGLSKTFGILYGTASIAVSCSILAIDVVLKEPIGIVMIIDAFVVGKAVDLFNKIDLVPKCHSYKMGIPVMIVGLIIMAYTEYIYMSASLGCGPRDTLLVALAKRAKKLPIGAILVILLTTVTLVGWLLGGPVGVGTIICAFGMGPIVQTAFHTVRFDATKVRHQHLLESIKVIIS